MGMGNTCAGIAKQTLVICLISALTTLSQAATPGVDSWVYQLQDLDLVAAAANSTFEMIVMDYSSDGTETGEYSFENIKLLRDSGKKAVSYISIGEAEDYRFYWSESWSSNPPAWLGPVNPDWPGNYKVRFWYPEWEAIIFSYIDRIVSQGFDGIYMDIIDAYYYWSEEVSEEPAADSLMAEFVCNIREHLSDTYGLSCFLVLPQNGSFLIVEDDVSPALRTAYLNAIDAIGVEDVFCPGDQDENNPFDPDQERIEMLDEYLGEGKPIFSVEYLTNPSLVSAFVDSAQSLRYFPFVSVRALDELHDGIAPQVPLPQEIVDLRLSLVAPGAAQLAWSASTGAQNYNIYRVELGSYCTNAPWVSGYAATTVDITSGITDQLLNYVYFVRAANTIGESGDSNRVGEIDYSTSSP